MRLRWKRLRPSAQLFFSKSLLRHPQARSNIEEMGPGTVFQRYIPEAHPEGMAKPEDIKRHIVRRPRCYVEASAADIVHSFAAVKVR
jgi:2-oxoglutarate dehydrogenase complex dehydrogenase (E1) component-like enzyme